MSGLDEFRKPVDNLEDLDQLPLWDGEWDEDDDEWDDEDFEDDDLDGDLDK